MQSIQTTVLCASLTAAALTAAESILPMERFEKQMRAIFLCLLMLSLLRPLIGMRLTLPETDENMSLAPWTAAAQAAQEQAAEECLRENLQQALTERNVNCEVRQVTVHISENGSIEIDAVEIAGNTLTATVYLREWLGTQPVITVSGEEAANQP